MGFLAWHKGPPVGYGTQPEFVGRHSTAKLCAYGGPTLIAKFDPVDGDSTGKVGPRIPGTIPRGPSPDVEAAEDVGYTD